MCPNSEASQQDNLKVEQNNTCSDITAVNPACTHKPTRRCKHQTSMRRSNTTYPQHTHTYAHTLHAHTFIANKTVSNCYTENLVNHLCRSKCKTIQTRIHTCKNVHAHKHTHTHTQTRTYTHTHTHTHTQRHTGTTHTHTCTHTHTQPRTHTHAHQHAQIVP